MNWVFLDFIRWDYDVATPRERPLGGSQSALCYLATALALRGEQVTMLTGTQKPGTIDGIRCLRYEEIPADVFSPPDTVTIVLNGPADMAAVIRDSIPAVGPLVLWTQHAHDQPAMQPLRDPSCAALWDHIVCISDWQKSMFERQLGVGPARIEVLRNAIGPMFEGLFRNEADLTDAKSESLRLAYTSTPFRGLDVLVACFPAIHRRHPQARLDVFSSMQVYDQAVSRDPYKTLYDQCRATEGIDYRGSVAQPELAKALRRASILAYPNTFAETGCIAAMEALAAGLLVVSSDLGALPETCEGWGRLIPPVGTQQSKQQFGAEFVRVVIHAISDLEDNRRRFLQERYKQAQTISSACTWAVRSGQWQQAAARWLKQR